MNNRRFGIPLTEEERQEQHKTFYPGEGLPERGTGLGRRITEEPIPTAGLQVSLAAFSIFLAVMSALTLNKIAEKCRFR